MLVSGENGSPCFLVASLSGLLFAFGFKKLVTAAFALLPKKPFDRDMEKKLQNRISGIAKLEFQGLLRADTSNSAEVTFVSSTIEPSRRVVELFVHKNLINHLKLDLTAHRAIR